MNTKLRDVLITFSSTKYTKYPSMESRDLYKFLYQAWYGTGHMIENIQSAKDRFLEEWERTEPQKPGSIQDVVEPNFLKDFTTEFCLVHLAEARFLNIDPMVLFEEFLASVEKKKGVAQSADSVNTVFKSAWGMIGDLIDSSLVVLQKDDFDKITALVEKNNWPALHHSEAFKNAYSPHYRLVIKSQRLQNIISPW